MELSSLFAADRLPSFEHHLPEGAATIAQAYVLQHHRTAVFALLYGSYLDGKATRYSDIDIFIIRDDLPQGFVFEQRIFQSQMLQVTLANSVSLLAAINGRADGMLLGAIADGRPLCGDVLTVSYFKKLAKAAQQKGPLPLNEVHFEKSRVLLATFCMKLCSESPFEEKAHMALKLVSMLQDLVIRTAGRWPVQSRFAVRTLREIDSTLCDTLYETLQQAIAEGKFSKLAELAQQTMASRGGLYWETSPGKLFPC